MKSTIRYFLITGLTVILLIEVVLRLTGTFKTYSEKVYGQYTTYWNETRDSYFHSHNPNDSFYLDQTEFRYLYETNSFGHREKEIDTTIAGMRLFVFGDSFAEGVGAPYDSSWPRFLEQQLLEDSIDVDVYICSTAGGDPFDNYISLREQFLQLHPTHVIFTFNTSDLSDYAFRTGFKRFRPDGKVVFRKGEWWHGLYRYSHMVRAYIHSLGEYGPTLLKDSEWGRLQNEAVDSIAYCLEVSRELCELNNVRFLALTHSGPLEICLDDPASRSIGKIENREYNCPIVHLDNGIMSAITGDECMNYGWRNDGHYNSLGYKVFADILYQEINQVYKDFWEVQTHD